MYKTRIVEVAIHPYSRLLGLVHATQASAAVEGCVL